MFTEIQARLCVSDCVFQWLEALQTDSKKKAPVSEFASFSPFLTVFSCFFFQNIIFCRI